jgi:serine protease
MPLSAAALRALLVLFVGAMPAIVTAAPADERPVTSLLLQWRDAPSHAARARERAAGDTRRAAAEAARWQALTRDEPALVGARRQAVGERAQRLSLSAALSATQARALAERLGRHPEVALATPNTRERRMQAAANAPTDPFYPGFGQQWWLQAHVGSDAAPIEQRLRGVPGFLTAWLRYSAGSQGAPVAVLDSGVLANHPDLEDNLLPGYDMVDDSEYANDGDGRDADPSDPGDWVDAADRARDPARYRDCADERSSWHGTAIAGIVGAGTNNGRGVASINWRARVLPVRVAGKCGADVGDIIDGMLWAAGQDVCRRSAPDASCLEFVPRNPNPVRTVTLSFGGSGDCSPYQPTIDRLRALGVVVVAAAGNQHATPTRPAKCPGVIGVAALNRDGFKANYSNFGPELSAAGIATVGGDDSDIETRWNTLADSGLLSIGNSGLTRPQVNDYFHYYGTSFAAPLVAGTVSLMLSVNPALSVDQIVHGLRVSARPHVTSSLPGVAACSALNPGRCLCTAATCGAGILDAVQALAYAQSPATYVAPARQAEVIDAPELRQAALLGADRPANTSSSSGSGGPDSGSGGGAMSALWLAALAWAVLALSRRR